VLGWVNGLSDWCSVIYGVMALSPSVADLLPAARIAWCNQAWPWPGGPKATGYSTENSEEPTKYTKHAKNEGLTRGTPLNGPVGASVARNLCQFVYFGSFVIPTALSPEPLWRREPGESRVGIGNRAETAWEPARNGLPSHSLFARPEAPPPPPPTDRRGEPARGELSSAGWSLRTPARSPRLTYEFTLAVGCDW
jgi:hypothetical protein